MNYYEIGKALEEAGKQIKQLPCAFLDNADADLQSRYDKMAGEVEKYQQRIQSEIKKLTELDEQHATKVEVLVQSIQSRYCYLEDAADRIDTNRIYKIEKMVGIIQKLRSVSPDDLKLLKEILEKCEH